MLATELDNCTKHPFNIITITPSGLGICRQRDAGKSIIAEFDQKQHIRYLCYTQIDRSATDQLPPVSLEGLKYGADEPNNTTRDALLRIGFVKPYLQQQTKKIAFEKAFAFDILYALAGRPITLKSGSYSTITKAAIEAIGQVMHEDDVETYILRCDATALIQTTKKVRDKIAAISSTQPTWETHALINKICAVRKISVCNQDNDEWIGADIGETPREQARSIDQLLRTNNAIPKGKGINQYGRDLALPEHAYTAYFCTGQTAAKRNPAARPNTPEPPQPPPLTPTTQPEDEEPNNNSFWRYTPLHQHTPQIYNITNSFFVNNTV